MKKLIMISVFTLVVLLGAAQERLKTQAIDFAKWNNKTKQWIWDPRSYVEIEIAIFNNVIVVNDEAGSVYITKETVYDKEDETRWTAFDENKVDCIVSMKAYTREKHITITYKNVCYRYVY